MRLSLPLCGKMLTSAPASPRNKLQVPISEHICLTSAVYEAATCSIPFGKHLTRFGCMSLGLNFRGPYDL